MFDIENNKDSCSSGEYTEGYPMSSLMPLKVDNLCICFSGPMSSEKPNLHLDPGHNELENDLREVNDGINVAFSTGILPKWPL